MVTKPKAVKPDRNKTAREALLVAEVAKNNGGNATTNLEIRVNALEAALRSLLAE
jgi:hypothetical protein